ncbi:MAG TPA: hypothetical protein VFY84_04665, partial [Jiangellales bacterium]|nr:hypothetical protein [Jiangellales bacterium]
MMVRCRLTPNSDIVQAVLPRAASKAGAVPVKAEAVFGSEVWRETGGGEWSFWDLWFCVVCLLDHGGDWTEL